MKPRNERISAVIHFQGREKSKAVNKMSAEDGGHGAKTHHGDDPFGGKYPACSQEGDSQCKQKSKPHHQRVRSYAQRPQPKEHFHLTVHYFPSCAVAK